MTDLSTLEKLFRPTSVALIGASETAGSLGTVVLANLREAGFEGEVVLVNPKYEALGGAPCYPSMSAAGKSVDLAIVVAPAAAVPDIIADCGACDIDAAVVLSAGFREAGAAGKALERRLLDRAAEAGVRLLGPNCLGIIRTDVRLNATFSAGNALPGRVAVVSQSGALCTAILDWASENSVGFSSLISTGIGADAGFAEALDFLSLDAATDSIMLYIEGISDARRFLSALRAAARVKPVVIMKGGRHAQGSRAAVSHTGALVGSDPVFDAAIRRAGALRVADFPDFFAAAETLDSGVRTPGPRLAVVTNAGGPGVMAADHASDLGLALASLAPETVRALAGRMPHGFAGGNPVDVLGDATPERYADALAGCLADPGVDAVLAILTPQALTAPLDVARRLVEQVAGTRKPVLACWMGERSVATSRALFREHEVPAYRTPEAAVGAFAALNAYRESQRQLLEVPDPQGLEQPSEVDNARLIIEQALAEDRRLLSIAESKAVLSAFNIPVLPSLRAASAHEAVLVAQNLGYPVAMKIDSPDITHKSDVGGVRLGLVNARQVRGVFGELTRSVAEQRPGARIAGVVIEPMWRGGRARELLVGVSRDDVFGVCITCGVGGTMVELISEVATALPPLNRYLAGALIDRTRVGRLLEAFRGAPPADRRAVEDLLLCVSEMVCALPMIEEMDLNPIMVDEQGARAVDARIVVASRPTSSRPYDHMAIHPYPREWVGTFELSDGTPVTVRPIRPEDASIERTFVEGLSEESRYFRFMHALKRLSPQMLSRFTQLDYDREMALITTVSEGGAEREIAVARYAADRRPDTCEFAIAVADDWQRRGVARLLMDELVRIARDRGFRTMVGMVLAQNRPMLEFAESLGFVRHANAEERDVVEVRLAL